jgi:hypothetical protein
MTTEPYISIDRGVPDPRPRGAGSSPARDKTFLVISVGIAVTVEGALEKMTMFTGYHTN